MEHPKIVGQMKPSIQCVTLGVKDLRAAVSFYESLGLTVVLRHGGAYGQINMTSFFLNLCPWGLLAKELGIDECAVVAGGRTVLSHHVDSSAEVDQLVGLACGAGAVLIRGTVWRPWGGWSAVFADLDGHLWEIVSKLGSGQTDP